MITDRVRLFLPIAVLSVAALLPVSCTRTVLEAEEDGAQVLAKANAMGISNIVLKDWGPSVQGMRARLGLIRLFFDKRCPDSVMMDVTLELQNSTPAEVRIATSYTRKLLTDPVPYVEGIRFNLLSLSSGGEWVGSVSSMLPRRAEEPIRIGSKESVLLHLKCGVLARVFARWIENATPVRGQFTGSPIIEGPLNVGNVSYMNLWTGTVQTAVFAFAPSNGIKGVN
jgi:hypothetical protein